MRHGPPTLIVAIAIRTLLPNAAPSWDGKDRVVEREQDRNVDDASAGMSLDDQHRIARALVARGISQSCPVCEPGVLQIADAYALLLMSHHVSEVTVEDARQARLVVLWCRACGYTQLHHLAGLGLA